MSGTAARGPPTARRRSTCALCQAPIEAGAPIAKHGKSWVHEACAAAAAPEPEAADGASIGAPRVCRHWQRYGSCGYVERCSFEHPPALARQPQVVIGIGTGRCGTLSLALLLDRQPDARVQHEPEVDQGFFPWDTDSISQRRDLVARHYELLHAHHRPLVGAVHYAYLPYAEEYIAQDPTVKIIALQRPRGEVVTSWLRFTEGTNHWQPPPGRPQNRWEKSFPSFPDAADKAVAIGLYWDEYNTRVLLVHRRPAIARGSLGWLFENIACIVCQGVGGEVPGAGAGVGFQGAAE